MALIVCPSSLPCTPSCWVAPVSVWHCTHDLTLAGVAQLTLDAGRGTQEGINWEHVWRCIGAAQQNHACLAPATYSYIRVVILGIIRFGNNGKYVVFHHVVQPLWAQSGLEAILMEPSKV